MTSEVADIPSPQVGFNNNVKHRGRVFHIQTEDSGMAHPHIITHLFVDGGLVIKSAKTDYSDVLSEPNLAAILRKRMKEQHKAMFVDLREGRLDAMIDEVLGVSSERGVSTMRLPAIPANPMDALRRGGGANGALAKVVQASSSVPASTSICVDEEAKSDVSASSSLPISDWATSPSQAGGEPAAETGRRPDAVNIFGGSPLSKESLDDVILSYISSDVDGAADG